VSHVPVSLDRIDERQREIRADIEEIRAEMSRTRTRLHNLEGFAAAYQDMQQMNRRAEERQYRRVEIRLQVLTIVLGLATILSPLVTVLLLGK
jgi:predicted  nucleic acid-binding Zn-ribbon protein